MLMLSLPLAFKVGDTAPVRINAQPTTVTWRDEHTLVLGSEDARRITHIGRDDKLATFMCSDADGTTPTVFF